MLTAEIVVGIGDVEVEVDIVDDEIGEINGGTGDKVEEGIANDEIGEKHDVVGERGEEVYVEAGILSSRTFSVNEHIRRMLLPSEIAYIPVAEVTGCEFHQSPFHHSPCSLSSLNPPLPFPFFPFPLPLIIPVPLPFPQPDPAVPPPLPFSHPFPFPFGSFPPFPLPFPSVLAHCPA